MSLLFTDRMRPVSVPPAGISTDDALRAFCGAGIPYQALSCVKTNIDDALAIDTLALAVQRARKTLPVQSHC